MKAIGRDAAVVNLDPANHGDGLPYEPDIDIEDLVSLEVKHLACIAVPSPPSVDDDCAGSPVAGCAGCPTSPLGANFKSEDLNARARDACGHLTLF